MNRLPLTTLIALLSLSCFAQEPYKCKINGSVVFQDRPCPGAPRYPNDPQTSAPRASTAPQQSSRDLSPITTSPADAQRAKTEREKAYIDERVKARISEREKSDSLERIAHCEAEASGLMAQADAVLRSPRPVYTNNLAGAMATQADNQNIQTEVMALQAKAADKRAQCDTMRREHEGRFPNKK